MQRQAVGPEAILHGRVDNGPEEQPMNKIEQDIDEQVAFGWP